MTLLLYQQILESRRIEALVVQQLLKARQTCDKLDRDAVKLRARLEKIPEEEIESEAKEPLQGLAVLPGQTDIRRYMVPVRDNLKLAMDDELPDLQEDHMREALEDELLERVEDSDIDGSPLEDSDDDAAMEILRKQARRSAAREEAWERWHRGEPGHWIP